MRMVGVILYVQLPPCTCVVSARPGEGSQCNAELRTNPSGPFPMGKLNLPPSLCNSKPSAINITVNVDRTPHIFIFEVYSTDLIGCCGMVVFTSLHHL